MLGLLVATPALHAQERRPTRGERLALEGRCEVALPELERELAHEPEDARIAWRLGQCALRLRQYDRAVVALERALARDPDLDEAQLDLARARFHRGDLDGADEALRAGEALSGEALWQLYRGLVDLRRGDAPAAVEALQRAVALDAERFRTRQDPQAVEPMASYYLGIALRAAGQEARARETLGGVADSWAGTDWAVQADRALGRGGVGERAWLTLGGGFEYDDNVVLAGRDTPLPEDISDEQDVRGVWQAFGGFDLGRWGDTSSGLLGSYRGRAHFDGELREFDSHFPSASLWLNHALRSDTHVRVRYDFGYAWVDRDPFLVTNGGRVSLIHAWSPRQSSALHGSLVYDDYLFSTADVSDGTGAPGDACPPGTVTPVCGPPGLNERIERNRDGWGVGGGLTHALTLPLGLGLLPDPSLSGGYRYTSFEASGREYSHQEHRLFLGLAFVLPWGAGLDLEGTWSGRAYRHPSTFPDPDALQAGSQYGLSGTRRREDAFTGGGRLSVPLGPYLSTSAYYRYRDNRSTSDVFDYDQHVVGIVLDVAVLRAR